VVSRFSALQRACRNIEMTAKAERFQLLFRSGAAVRFLRPVPARFLPGSCPVSARFLPSGAGSCPVQDCPVPARQPGSIRLSVGWLLRRSRAATGRTSHRSRVLDHV